MLSLRSIALSLIAALTVLSSGVADAKPLKVYILVGQSNMQGHAKEVTLTGLGMDPETRPLYDKLVDGSGKTRVHENVYIAAFSRTDGWGKIGDAKEKNGKLTVGYGGNLTDPDKLGPELGFGVTMVENLKEPILLIKTAWGGKSLMVDFRPPSAGIAPVPADKAEKLRAENKLDEAQATQKEKSGHFYRLMIEHVKTVLADPGRYCPAYNPKDGCEIAGFAWFQGFNDLVGPYPPIDPGKGKQGGKDYSEYSRLLACLIRDVRKDLSVPKLPFAIGVLGVGGINAKENTDLFRKAMAAPAGMEEFKGNVANVMTADFWDEKLGELEERKDAAGMKKGKRKDTGDKYAALREKMAPLQKELDILDEQKGKDRNKAKIDELSKRIQDILYTPEEQDYIAKNKSNQGYHYMGSAKTYSRVGEALAKAIVEMNRKKE